MAEGSLKTKELVTVEQSKESDHSGKLPRVVSGQMKQVPWVSIISDEKGNGSTWGMTQAIM